MDTAPNVVDAECIQTVDGAELQISNRWRLPNGREDEWPNNLGMTFEPTEDNGIILYCSDGYGDEPSFDDLVVRVDVLPQAT
jgi:hypothetical protein